MLVMLLLFGPVGLWGRTWGLKGGVDGVKKSRLKLNSVEAEAGTRLSWAINSNLLTVNYGSVNV